MRLDLAERLRCPRPHAVSPMIVVSQESRDRELLRGFAGCPTCFVEARIEEGDVRFPDAVSSEAVVEVRDAERVDRLIALLGLAESGGAVLLSGAYASMARALVLAVDVDVVVMRAAMRGDARGVSVVHAPADAVPFSDNTFRAAALDATVGLGFAAEATRAVQVGGRVLGAVTLERPVLVKELARDETEWVGERQAGPGGIVTIRRA